LKPEGGDEVLEVGLADALITRLSNIKRIIVRPTSAVLRYAGPSTLDLGSAGRELGVDALLSGHVQQEGDRIRVTVQLVRVADGATLWAESFNDSFTNIFAVQDSISEKVTHALALELTGEERRMVTKRYTENTEAYQEYLKGRWFWNKRTEETIKKGIECFARAAQMDPNYAQAYAGIAESYAILNMYSVNRSEDAFPKARDAALKALALDDALAEAHNALGLVKEQYEFDWSGAEVEFKRAIELNPNYATAHQWYSEYLAFLGRTEESLGQIKRAYELDPTSLIITTTLGFPYMCARRCDQAIEEFQKALEMDLRFPLTRYYMGNCYVQKGMLEEAVAEYRQAVAHSRGSAMFVAGLGYALAASGRKDEALWLLNELLERSKNHNISATSIAEIYAGLGERDQALAWLEKAYREREDLLVTLKVNTRLHGLRADPRFTDLLRRVGLPSS
jgi:tetratricopeptide (TPR) repeat protein